MYNHLHEPVKELYRGVLSILCTCARASNKAKFILQLYSLDVMVIEKMVDPPEELTTTVLRMIYSHIIHVHTQACTHTTHKHALTLHTSMHSHYTQACTQILRTSMYAHTTHKRACRSSVVRASTAKVGGLGFDSQWLPKFFPSVCFYSDLSPVAYQQFLLPVVVIRMVTKNNHAHTTHKHACIQHTQACMYTHHTTLTHTHIHMHIQQHTHKHALKTFIRIGAIDYTDCTVNIFT